MYAALISWWLFGNIIVTFGVSCCLSCYKCPGWTTTWWRLRGFWGGLPPGVFRPKLCWWYLQIFKCHVKKYTLFSVIKDTCIENFTEGPPYSILPNISNLDDFYSLAIVDAGARPVVTGSFNDPHWKLLSSFYFINLFRTRFDAMQQKILGPVRKGNGIWWIRTNGGLEDLLVQSHIINENKDLAGWAL